MWCDLFPENSKNLWVVSPPRIPSWGPHLTGWPSFHVACMLEAFLLQGFPPGFLLPSRHLEGEEQGCSLGAETGKQPTNQPLGFLGFRVYGNQTNPTKTNQQTKQTTKPNPNKEINQPKKQTIRFGIGTEISDSNCSDVVLLFWGCGYYEWRLFVNFLKLTSSTIHRVWLWQCGCIASCCGSMSSDTSMEKKDPSESGWWFQPIWKILVKLHHFPRVRGENSKNIWNHQPVIHHVGVTNPTGGFGGWSLVAMKVAQVQSLL